MKPILNILYIGNSPDYFQMINENIALVHVENSITAINYLNANNPVDAILCHFDLPGNNGLFLYDGLRENLKYVNMPFILLSKEFSNKIYKLSNEKKVDDYYATSASSPNQIINRIEFLCNHKKALGNTKIEKTNEEVFRMPISKRFFDIVVASSVLLLAFPFLLIILLAISLESKGKVYYISKRVGRKTFDFYKLRSMRTGSDALLKNLAKEKNQYKSEVKSTDDVLTTACPKCSHLPEGETCSPLMYIDTYQICDNWYGFQKNEAAKNNSTFVKIVDDPRVTKVGKFIRNTSIDELPQLINVLKGDMSIVGNRPLPVYEAELLTKDHLSKRFLAPAGITGLWQVELRGNGGKMSETERMRLDNEYANHFKGDNYSFWYDIKLFLRTIPALLQKSSV